MDIGFLFGWTKEQGVDLPTKADGSINIPAAFALYDEWKKKGGGGKAKDDGEKLSKNGLPSGGKGDKINLTKQEWAQYYKTLGDEQHGDFVYRTKNGGRCVRLQSKIIIDNGDFVAPAVTGVIEFASDDDLNDALNIFAAEGVIQ